MHKNSIVKNSKVSVIIGSKSDMEYAKKCTDTLEKLCIQYELKVLSAHRTPEELDKYVKQADSEGVQVFIAMAGGAAHLPGVVASKTLKPVIGVPVPTTFMGGLDSLLSIVQMPSGIPVATVGTNNGGPVNAALLAGQILALTSLKINENLKKYREELKKK